MKKLGLIYALLALISGSILQSCNKEESSSDGSSGGGAVTVNDACRLTSFNLEFMGETSSEILEYNALNQLVTINSQDPDGQTKTVLTYNSNGLIASIGEYNNDTLNSYKEYEYENKTLIKEIEYSVIDGVKMNVLFNSNYVYTGNNYVKNKYANWGQGPVLLNYANYFRDNKGNITKVESYSRNTMDSTVTLISTETYTYSNVISNKGLNWIFNSEIEYLNSVNLPSQNVSTYQGMSGPETSTVNFNWTNLNPKGYPQSVSASSGTFNVQGTLAYTCD
jgi:hypothetical protein